MLDSKILAMITRQVEARFPEIKKSQPRVRLQAVPKSPRPDIRFDAHCYLITYRSNVDLASGEQIERWVRVVVDTHGKILKITTSR